MYAIRSYYEAVGTRALLDADYRSRSMAAASEYAAHLYGLLKDIPEISLFPGQANFLLCRLTRGDMDARGLAERLLAHRIAIRVCDNFRGLDETWFRLAVRPPEENERLAEALRITSYNVCYTKLLRGRGHTASVQPDHALARAEVGLRGEHP